MVQKIQICTSAVTEGCLKEMTWNLTGANIRKKMFFLDWNNRCESFFGCTVAKENWLYRIFIISRLKVFKGNRSK